MVTLVLLALMLLGGALGYILRKQRTLINYASKLITYVVYFLLLIMGISVGVNDELFADLPRVGLQSLVITVFALAGTIFFAWIFKRFVLHPTTSTATKKTENSSSELRTPSTLQKVFESLSFFLVFMVGVGIGHYIEQLAAFFASTSTCELKTFLRGGVIDSAIVYILYVLMLCVGLSTGGSEDTFKALRGMGIKALLLPLFTIVGTALGVLLALPFFKDLLLKDVEVVGAGYAYYSLSSVIIKAEYSELIAAIAIVSNIIRELSTIMLAPLYVRLGGEYAPICCAGATSGDTVLPFILKATSPQYAVLSVYHGLALTFFVPFAVPLALLL